LLAAGPSGWSWSTTAAGTICCRRDSDGAKTSDSYSSDADGKMFVIFPPAPLQRCLAAVQALMTAG
jgi:hypothetical protein